MTLKTKSYHFLFFCFKTSQIHIWNKYLVFLLKISIFSWSYKHKDMCKQRTGTKATTYDLIMQSFIVKLEKDKYILFQTDKGCSMGTVKNKKIITQPRKHSIMVGKFYWYPAILILGLPKFLTNYQNIFNLGISDLWIWKYMKTHKI